MEAEWSPQSVEIKPAQKCPFYGLKMWRERVIKSASGSHRAVTVSAGSFWKDQKGFGQGPKSGTCWSVLGHSDKLQGAKKSLNLKV